MLEVGNMATFEEDRAHFVSQCSFHLLPTRSSFYIPLPLPSTQGAWCIISSPLVLGYDVTDASITEKIWPIISNRKAVQVNQRYAGHPGRLIKAWNVEAPPPTPQGAGFLVASNCSKTPATQGWAYDASSGHLTHDGECVDSSADQSELQVTTCDATSPNRE
jgi:hypothetical protein